MWEYGSCGGSRCGSIQTCGMCLADAQCGWCESRCACYERPGKDDAKDKEGPLFGTCEKGWYTPNGSRTGGTCPAGAAKWAGCSGVGAAESLTGDWRIDTLPGLKQEMASLLGRIDSTTGSDRKGADAKRG